MSLDAIAFIIGSAFGSTVTEGGPPESHLRINTFYGCMTVETGCFVIGVFKIVVCPILMVMASTGLEHVTGPERTTFMVLLAFAALTFVESFALICIALRGRYPRCLLTCLVVDVFSHALLVVFVILTLMLHLSDIKNHSLQYYALTYFLIAIGILMAIYHWLVIYTFYLDLNAGGLISIAEDAVDSISPKEPEKKGKKKKKKRKSTKQVKEAKETKKVKELKQAKGATEAKAI